MLRNPYREFLELLPVRTLQVGTVLDATGSVVTVELPGGGRLQARGQASVGDRVFVRDGLVEGAAPNLPYVSAEV